MIDLNGIKKVYLFSGATDFRKGMYGLLQMVNLEFDLENINDVIFLFVNSTKTGVKILQKDYTGLWLYYKRLDKGKFVIPNTTTNAIITPDELKIILTGLDFIKLLEKNDKKEKKIQYF